jgi:hypothetical protein
MVEAKSVEPVLFDCSGMYAENLHPVQQRALLTLGEEGQRQVACNLVEGSGDCGAKNLVPLKELKQIERSEGKSPAGKGLDELARRKCRLLYPVEGRSKILKV